AAAFEPAADGLQMRALAGALAAFQGDEARAHDPAPRRANIIVSSAPVMRDNLADMAAIATGTWPRRGCARPAWRRTCACRRRGRRNTAHRRPVDAARRRWRRAPAWQWAWAAGRHEYRCCTACRCADRGA